MGKKHHSTQVSREICNKIWQACDTFRGIVDPAQYKDYIITMLFLRYVSDHSGQDHTAHHPYFSIPPHAHFHYLHHHRDSPHLGSLINQALASLEQANHQHLANVLCGVDFDSEANLGDQENRHRRLKTLLENFHQLGVTFHDAMLHGDSIGDAYIYLIEKFASTAGKKAGEFYTPHTLALLMAMIAAPEPGQSICDPACGSGSLLLEIAKRVPWRKCQLFGMEVNQSTWALAKMNMFLHTISNAHITRCDTLTAPMLYRQDHNGHKQLLTFDLVVANPPFSLSKWGRELAATDPFGRYHRGLPPSSRGDWAFLSHMIEVAKPREGKIVVIVPHGVLFREGAEQKIRAQVVRENLVDSVIGLPPNLFPSTSISVALLVLDRRREQGADREHVRDILFVDCNHLPPKSPRQKRVFNQDMVEEIELIYRRRYSLPGVAAVVPVDDVMANDANLNIPRYVYADTHVHHQDIHSLQQEIAEFQQNLEKVNEDVASYITRLHPIPVQESM